MRWWEELDAPLLGRYRVERLLGKGGMAVVLLARDERFGRRVAIKAPDLEDFAPSQLRELLMRFQREVQRQGSEMLSGVVPMLDAGEVTDSSGRQHPFLVMDYLPGGSLADALGGTTGQRARTQTLAEVNAWLKPIATTLDRLHARKFLHRDVKPDNILFNADGDPLLADFGIATTLDDIVGGGTLMSTVGGSGPGSPGYQTPETLRGEKFAASDQFSLATTVYEALTGRLPMHATTRDGWIGALANWRPTPISDIAPELPPVAAAAIMRALSLEVHARFASCSDFAAEMARAAIAPVEAPKPPVFASTPAPPPAPPPLQAAAAAVAAAAPAQAAKATRSSRLPWIISGLALLVAVGFIVVSNMVGREPEESKPILVQRNEFGQTASDVADEEAKLNAAVLAWSATLATHADAVFKAETTAITAGDGGKAALANALENSLKEMQAQQDSTAKALEAARLADGWFRHGHPSGMALLLEIVQQAKRVAEFEPAYGRSLQISHPSADFDAGVRPLATKAKENAEAANNVLTQLVLHGPPLSPPLPEGALADLHARIARLGVFAADADAVRAEKNARGESVEGNCSSHVELRAAASPASTLDMVSAEECPHVDRALRISLSLALTDAISREEAKGVMHLESGECHLGGALCPDLSAAQLEKEKKKSVESTLALVNDSLLMVKNAESGTIFLSRPAAPTPASP